MEVSLECLQAGFAAILTLRAKRHLQLVFKKKIWIEKKCPGEIRVDDGYCRSNPRMITNKLDKSGNWIFSARQYDRAAMLRARCLKVFGHRCGCG
jgi:hypothetical protein